MDDLVGGGHGDDEAPRHGALPHQEDSISVSMGGQDLVGSVPGEVDVEPGLRSVNCGLSLCQTICHGSCHSPPDHINILNLIQDTNVQIHQLPWIESNHQQLKINLKDNVSLLSQPQ